MALYVLLSTKLLKSMLRPKIEHKLSKAKYILQQVRTIEDMSRYISKKKEGLKGKISHMKEGLKG